MMLMVAQTHEGLGDPVITPWRRYILSSRSSLVCRPKFVDMNEKEEEQQVDVESKGEGLTGCSPD
jgi:hypothetical protein